MADFHEYYSGVRIAPVLTIFIGGNHEASNHLFELYYGGWVAPNIYYMGAANVLQIGNLRIAGMSGIWKGYDYRRPHFERLPYNSKDMYGIYHVRELDVRKLLAIRSQVDVGMSHDWPQSVEWSGDWAWLFKKKDRFQQDSENSRLGSTAAKYVLDRLRPKHWFSAHLHIRYEATYDHNNPTGIQTKYGKLLQETKALSAWHGFHETAKQTDVEEHKQYLEEQEKRDKERQENGYKPAPGYTFNETFKQVTMGDNLSRTINIVDKPLPSHDGPPQLDGCSFSRPLKRQREQSSSPPQQPRSPRYQALGTPAPRDVALDNDKMEQVPKGPAVPKVAKNPDELDIDLSEDDTTIVPKTVTSTTTIIAKNPDELDVDISDEETPIKIPPRAGSPFPDLSAQAQSRRSDLSEDGGVILNPQAFDFVPKPVERKVSNGSKSSKPSLDASAKGFKPMNGEVSPRKSTDSDLRPNAAEFEPTETTTQHEDIPDDIRAELAGLSKTFEAPVEVEVSAALPFPEDITNKTTNFLALDKCLPNRHFLELLEIESLNPDLYGNDIYPVKLRYDPEWLAIIRAFHPELKLGGEREDPVPDHKGDTYYQERILEERKWVAEHIVAEGKLDVPENFMITAPVFDPNLDVPTEEMPREVTNPQTSEFCKLVGIENLFDISEEERDARMQRGPKPEDDRGWGGRGGRGGGRGRGWGGGGRGGRGGGRGGYGRGRGRGGGRGRFY